jgi:hypothetical protein
VLRRSTDAGHAGRHARCQDSPPRHQAREPAGAPAYAVCMCHRYCASLTLTTAVGEAAAGRHGPAAHNRLRPGSAQCVYVALLCVRLPVCGLTFACPHAPHCSRRVPGSVNAERVRLPARALHRTCLQLTRALASAAKARCCIPIAAPCFSTPFPSATTWRRWGTRC